MHWDDYLLVLTLHRHGTLRAAAKALGVNHTTLSRRLAALDPALFDKIKGKYRITQQGKAILEAGEEMEAAALKAERKLRADGDVASGRVTVSIPNALGHFLLLDDFGRFARVHPTIQLIIKSSYDFVDLDRSEADIVIRATENPPDHLVGRRLLPFYVAAYCARTYLETTPPDRRIWIRAKDKADREDEHSNVPYSEVPTGLIVEDATTRHYMAAAAHGLTIGACYMDDQNPALMRLPGSVPRPLHDIWVLTHPDLRDTPRIRMVMQYLCDAILAKEDLLKGRPA